MKWFKHYSNANESETLETIIEKMGYEGYGMYWRLIELLSSNYDGETVDSSFRLSTIKRLLGIRVTTKLDQLADIVGTMSPLSINIDNDRVFFSAPILSNLKAKDFKRSRPSRDKVTLEENRIEENRIEENILRDCAKTPKIDYQFFMSHWNNLLGESLSSIKVLTSKRKTLIRTLLKEYPDFNLLDYLKIIESSDFLMGSTSKWKANFDWAFNHSNYLKVIEGRYENNTNVKTNADIKQDKMLDILKGYENADRKNNY